VNISGFTFIPQNLTINVGDTVVWNNTDPVIHSLWFVFVANGSTYLLSDPILPHTTWNTTFSHGEALQYYSFDMLWISGFINFTTDIHDLAATNVSTSKTGCLPKEIIGEGKILQINVTVENQGNVLEASDVTVYANNTVIGAQPVNLNPAEVKILAFSWNTTGFAKGNYWINATIAVVPFETDTADNVSVYGWTYLTMVGDIDGDRDVDIFDIVKMAGVYGIRWPDPRYNPNADVDGDGDIDIFDIVAAAANYGKSW
jgi:hypothetical protein